MAQEALIDGNLINDDRPLAVEQQGALPAGGNNIGDVDVQTINGVAPAFVGTKMRVSSMPYLYDIAEGNVADHFSINKFGFNPTVGATEETIWEESAAYAYLAAASQLTVSSSDVDDDAGDTGARTVELFGLDANYDLINETITLDGQNPVTTVESYLRIYRMIVRTAGTTGSNEGIIYAGTGAVVAGVPANVFATITIGHNQTLMALFTIPRDHTGYMVSMFGSTGITNKTTQLMMYVRPFGEVFQLKRIHHIIESETDHTFQLPEIIPGRADIEIRALASGGGGAVSAGFDLWYEED